MNDIKTTIGNTRFRYLALDVYNLYNGAINKNLNSNYDRQTLKIMKKILHKDSNCVDAGAHKGDILYRMSKYAPRGQHMAFEPLPKLYSALKKYFPSVEVYDYALGDKAGNALFNHVINMPSNSGLVVRDYGDLNPIIEKINVQVETLDNVYPADRHLDLIKVDIEGGEYHMFRGAANTIKKNRPVIIFEYGIGGADHYGVTPEMMYNLLVDDYELHISSMWQYDAPMPLEEFNRCYQIGEYYFVAHP